MSKFLYKLNLGLIFYFCFLPCVYCWTNFLTKSEEKIFDHTKSTIDLTDPSEDCIRVFVKDNSTSSTSQNVANLNSENPVIVLNSKNMSAFVPKTILSRHTRACSIAFYWIFPIQFETIHKEFIRNLPGGIFRSYHYIFTSNNILIQPVPPMIRQMHYSIFIHKKTKNDFDLSTLNIWCNGSIHLGKYINGKVNTIPGLLFRKWWDYGGASLTVALTPDYTKEEMDEFIETKKIKKYTITGTYETFKGFNATPKIYATAETATFGYKNTEGKWVGLIGAVLNGRADLTMSMAMTPGRFEVVMFPTAYFFDSVVFITGLTKEFQRTGSLSFMVEPLSPCVWLFVLVSFIGIYLTMIWKQSLQKIRGVSRSNYFLKVANIIVLPMVDQNANTSQILGSSQKDHLSRFVFIFWLFTMTVLGCAYKSKLINALLSPEIIIPPRTFTELASSDYEIGAVAYNETLIGQSFQAVNTTIGHEIRRRVKGYAYTQPECYLYTQTMNHVCIGVRVLVEMIASNYLIDGNGKQLYKVSTSRIFPIYGGMAAPISFPHTIEPISRITEIFTQGGFPQRWLELELRANRIQGRRLGKKLHNSTKEEEKNQEILHLIIILLCGHVLATAAFMVEKLKYHMSMK